MATAKGSGMGGDAGTGAAPDAVGGTTAAGLKQTLEQIEHEIIVGALRASRGNKAEAARALGITERLMGIRVKKLGIDWRALRLAMRTRTGTG
jgi:Nif-specific regulatory protein